MEGKYPASYLEREGANAPKVEPGDMEAIGSKLDFVGLNVYTADYVKPTAQPRGYAIVPRPTSYPHMASPWINVGPECIYWAHPQRNRPLASAGDLHHRERLLLRRRAQRRRPD